VTNLHDNEKLEKLKVKKKLGVDYAFHVIRTVTHWADVDISSTNVWSLASTSSSAGDQLCRINRARASEREICRELASF